MRLLNVDTMRVEEFVDDSTIPAYSILSHRWGDEEVLYRDIVLDDQGERSSEGWKKIIGCCRQTISGGLSYTWVDTCCIDKSSSAELSEAINSMYAWYRRADICYTYLSDVHDGYYFCNSRWFERGWTLQELLAPADVLFFDSSWTEIGFKTSLTSVISQRKGIDETALRDGSSFDTYSIAERMSWAADRRTTRVEDETYCLMGIFNVNMPLIYGEGRKAFFRLQEELLRRFDDASIFAYVAFESKFPGPSTLRVTQSGIDIRVSDHVDSEIYLEMDEEQRVGTVGLFSSSPSFFRRSAEFIPHRLLTYERGNLHQGSPERRNALTVELSGHLVKFQVPLWRVPINELSPARDSFSSRDESDSDILSKISNKHGFQLTLSSIQKLRKCVLAAGDSNWVVAFLDCRRRNAGAVGIILCESSKQGIYLRQHFPSMIEAEGVNLFYNDDALRIETIYVKADSLRTAQLEYPDPVLLQPKSFSQFQGGITFRSTNLSEFGFSQKYTVIGNVLAEEFYSSSNPDFPHIAFLLQGRGESALQSRLHFNAITCKLYPRSGLGHYDAIDEGAALASEVIPADRGATNSILLNDQHKLVMRSQMQWKREGSSLHIDSLWKQCLITLSIVSITKIAQER